MLPPLCETARAYASIIPLARAARNHLLCGVVYYVFNQLGDRFPCVREVLAHFQPRATAVEIRLAVLVHGIKRGVVQCGLGFTLVCPLFEQLFGRGVGVIGVNDALPP